MSSIKGTETTAIKHSIYIIGGEKGGVGKSFFARCMIEYCLSKKWNEQLTLIEADPTISDVAGVYQDKCKQIRFSDSKYEVSEPLEIFKEALKRTVIVNLPSNIAYQFDRFLSDMRVLTKEAKDKYQNLVYFFVTDGCYQSIKLFENQVEQYSSPEHQLQHILVFNPARLTCSGWFDYLNDYKSLTEIIKKYQIPVLCCPELPTDLQFKCDRNQWTYTQAKEKEEFFLDKQRIKKFIDRCESKVFDPLFENVNELKLGKLVEEQKKQREENKLPIPSKEEFFAW